MTFYEALEVLVNSENNKAVKEGQLEYGLYRAYDVVSVLQKLRKEYAPMVDMTEEQKRILDSYREPGLFDGDYAFYAFYEDTHAHRLGMRDNNLYDNLTEMQLMQAWLHPDDIQIKGEKQ